MTNAVVLRAHANQLLALALIARDQGDVDLAAMLTARAVRCVDEGAAPMRRKLN